MSPHIVYINLVIKNKIKGLCVRYNIYRYNNFDCSFLGCDTLLSGRCIQAFWRDLLPPSFMTERSVTYVAHSVVE
jgi:hypothetical protein